MIITPFTDRLMKSSLGAPQGNRCLHCTDIRGSAMARGPYGKEPAVVVIVTFAGMDERDYEHPTTPDFLGWN